MIGIYLLEYVFEKNFGNVVVGICDFGIEYLVVFDNNLLIWINYCNWYWFVYYLIDVEGIVCYIFFGEGNYVVIEVMIWELL